MCFPLGCRPLQLLDLPRLRLVDPFKGREPSAECCALGLELVDNHHLVVDLDQRTIFLLHRAAHSLLQRCASHPLILQQRPYLRHLLAGSRQRLLQRRASRLLLCQPLRSGFSFRRCCFCRNFGLGLCGICGRLDCGLGCLCSVLSLDSGLFEPPLQRSSLALQRCHARLLCVRLSTSLIEQRALALHSLPQAARLGLGVCKRSGLGLSRLCQRRLHLRAHAFQFARPRLRLAKRPSRHLLCLCYLSFCGP